MRPVPVAGGNLTHSNLLNARSRANRGLDTHGSTRPFCLFLPASLFAAASWPILPTASIRGASATHSTPDRDDGGTLPVRGIRCWIGAAAPRSHCPSACRTSLVSDYRSVYLGPPS